MHQKRFHLSFCWPLCPSITIGTCRYLLLLCSVTAPLAKHVKHPPCFWREAVAGTVECNISIIFIQKLWGKLAEPEVLTALFCSSKHEDGALIGISMTLCTVVSESTYWFSELFRLCFPFLIWALALSAPSPVYDQIKNRTKAQLKWGGGGNYFKSLSRYLPVNAETVAACLLRCMQGCPHSPDSTHCLLSNKEQEANEK